MPKYKLFRLIWNLYILFNNTLSNVTLDICIRLYIICLYTLQFSLFRRGQVFLSALILSWTLSGLVLQQLNGWNQMTTPRANELAEACDPASQVNSVCVLQAGRWLSISTKYIMFYRRACCYSLNRLGCRQQTTPPLPYKLKVLNEWRA